jgi:hypothetical protein
VPGGSTAARHAGLPEPPTPPGLARRNQQGQHRWWFETDSWRVAHSEYQARVSHYLADGPPPHARRVSRAQIRERYGV